MSGPSLDCCQEELDPVYKSLEIVQLEEEYIDCTNARFWRLNLFATSVEDPSISYIAITNKIKIISDINTRVLRAPIDINSITIGNLGLEEVLVVVGTQGIILVFFTMNIERKPIKLMNDSSTWGCAVKGSFIAVSDNSHKIKVWNMISNKFQNEYILLGHEHNIPCVDISPKGILVSCSIDRTCRVWDVLKKENLAIFHNDQWNWKTAIIQTTDVQRILNDDPILEFLNNISYAKPLINVSEDSLDSTSPAEFSLSDSEDGQYSPIHQNEIQDEIFQELPSTDEERMENSSQDERKTKSDDTFSRDQNIPIAEFPAQLYLLTDHERLFILQNSNPMTVLSWIHIIPENTYNQMQKISFLKWVPELSLCLVASPTGLVFLSRIVKNETHIGLIFERMLCKDSPDIILGLDVVKFIGEGYKLSILFESGNILNFKIDISM